MSTEMSPDTEVAHYTTSDVDDGYVAEGRTVRATMPRWSPLQIVGLIVGIGAAVLGIAGIASTGFDTAHIYTPQHVVGSFPHSPLLGVIEIGFGLLMVIGSVVPGGVRTLLGLLGAAALAFGLVVLIEAEPNRLNDWLAVTHRNGWLYVIAGAVVLLAAIFAPVFAGTARQRRVVHRTTTVL
jgi:hypothetical protein